MPSGASPGGEPAPLWNAPLQAAITEALVLEFRRLVDRLRAVGGRLHGGVVAGVVLAAVLVSVLVMMVSRGGRRLREGGGGNENGEAGDQDALHEVTR
ncbi:Xanthine dehydrogenase, iron-sulfur cluster and FAD-binding subunit A; Xanthine oxidase [Paraburkholderia tropica]|nr:Xanthine dehydrogenase, iron-sulfur cluster and FAD-binding subunit A; Xanthine oxidase [Paraburkholderia tropica]